MKPYQNNVIHFAKTDYPNDKRLFGIYQKDKVFHSLITGATGTGKTNLMQTMILGEIEHNHGSLVVVDPNGDMIQYIIANCPPERKRDIIHIDPASANSNFGYNPLRKVPEEHKHYVVSEVLEIFARLFKDSWGNRIAHILRHCVYLLLEQGHATLADIPKLLVDDKFRYNCRLRTKKEYIHDFWIKEFPKYRAESILPLLSQLGAFLHHPAIRRTLVEPMNNISLRHMIDHKKIVLISLSKGRLGSDVSSLIGSVLITSLSIAVYSRSNVPEWKRQYCSLYIDEFQNVTTSSIVGAFAEVRKYNLAITVATQYLAALKPEIRDAVLSNIGTLITFRVALDQARVLAKYLHPVFSPEHIISLPNHTICLVMMINGVVSVPFWARTVSYMDIYREKFQNTNRAI